MANYNRAPVSRMTNHRLHWLRHLERFGTASRKGWHTTPCQCMRFGWTRWVDAENGDFNERLTEEGRQFLRLYEEAHVAGENLQEARNVR